MANPDHLEILKRLPRPQGQTGLRGPISDRLHFFALTAHTMRNILVDRFRRRAAAKRGNESTHVTLETGSAEELGAPAKPS